MKLYNVPLSEIKPDTEFRTVCNFTYLINLRDSKSQRKKIEWLFKETGEMVKLVKGYKS